MSCSEVMGSFYAWRLQYLIFQISPSFSPSDLALLWTPMSRGMFSFLFFLITANNTRVKSQMIIKQTFVPVFLTPPHPMFFCMCTLTGRTIVGGRCSSPIFSSFHVGGKEVIDQHTLEYYQTFRTI